MNTLIHRYYRYGMAFVLIAGLGASSALAQPRSEYVERREPMRERVRDPEAVRPHVERWLETVKASDPDEYERLTELGDKDPMAFRMEVRQRLHDARIMQRMRAEHPDLHERWADLPREKRDRMRQALRETQTDAPAHRTRHRRTMHLDMRRDETVRALVQQWRAAETPAEQEIVQTDLRAHLAQRFDSQTEEQAEDIREAEERLERLRQIHAARKEKRGAWIDRVTEEVLQRQEQRQRNRWDRGQVLEETVEALD